MPPDLSCLANINITLDGTCSRTITPSMVLAGTYPISSEIVVDIDNNGTDVLTGCGNHTYTINIIEAGLVVFSCWGEINAEDKTAPSLICPPATSDATQLEDMQQLNGTLSTDDATFNPGFYSCYQEVAPPLSAGLRYYDTYTFSINTADVFTFIGVSKFDGLLSIYQGDFFPEDPCRNMIAQSDETFLGRLSDFDSVIPMMAPSLRLSLGLHPEQFYTIVYSCREPVTTGDYGIAIFSDVAGRILDLSKSQVLITAELVCLDIETISLTHQYSYSVEADGTLMLAYSEPYRIPQDLRNVFNLTGYPQVHDNCSAMIVTVYDELEEEGDCGDWIITRHFSVRDRYQSDCPPPALISSCTQVIRVRKPNLGDIVFPPFTSIIECDEDFPTDGIQGGPEDNPAPGFSGFPYLATAGNFYDLNQSVCNLGASYSDEPRIQVCPGSYYFRREWNFIDWCDPGNSLTYNQIIRVGDFTGPTIIVSIPDYDQNGLPDNQLQTSTSPFSCEALFNVPVPLLADGNGCSDIASSAVTITDENQAFVWEGLPGDRVILPRGHFSLRYCATDSCANTSCILVALLVRDAIAPTAACKDELLISLSGADNEGGTGVAQLAAQALDEGSSDHCGAVTLAIRREDTTWLDTVEFTCSDIGDTITVFLQVIDESLNRNTCWVQVVPEDKLNPFCYAPENRSLTCAALPLTFPGDLTQAYADDFAATSAMMNLLFGDATGTDNCAVDTIVERTPNLAVNECGWGTITRRFEAWQIRPEGDVNDNGRIDLNEVFRSTNSCSQLITITEVHDFVIAFPQDASADCSDPQLPNRDG